MKHLALLLILSTSAFWQADASKFLSDGLEAAAAAFAPVAEDDRKDCGSCTLAAKNGFGRISAFQMQSNRIESLATLAPRTMIRTLLVLFFPIAVSAADLPLAAAPVEQSREKYGEITWRERHQAILKRHKTVNPEVVFIGDSITHFWGGEPAAFKVTDSKSWQVATGGRVASNLGFGYDYIENARWRVADGELDGISPKVIVVLLGTNNLGHKKDAPEAAAATMNALLQDIQAKQPKAAILLLGVYPRREPELAAPILELNRRYAALASGRVAYRNVGEAITAPQSTPGAGPLPAPGCLRDKVHPSAAGYAKLAPLIAAEIERLTRSPTNQQSTTGK